MVWVITLSPSCSLFLFSCLLFLLCCATRCCFLIILGWKKSVVCHLFSYLFNFSPSFAFLLLVFSSCLLSSSLSAHYLLTIVLSVFSLYSNSPAHKLPTFLLITILCTDSLPYDHFHCIILFYSSYPRTVPSCLLYSHSVLTFMSTISLSYLPSSLRPSFSSRTPRNDMQKKR